MLIINPTPEERRKVRQRARKMGVLRGSITNGSGNEVGMMGEYLVHQHVGGTRVGEVCYAYDIILKNGITIDVKTTKATAVPELTYNARVYGKERELERLKTKCDVYYFVRCNTALTLATVIGWLPAKTFFEKALFTPRGTSCPLTGRVTFADEYTLEISNLYPAETKITRRLLSLA